MVLFVFIFFIYLFFFFWLREGARCASTFFFLFSGVVVVLFFMTIIKSYVLSKKNYPYFEKIKIKIKLSNVLSKKNPTRPPFFFFQIQSLKIPYPYPKVTYINNSIQNKNHQYRMKNNAEKNITKPKKKKKKPLICT